MAPKDSMVPASAPYNSQTGQSSQPQQTVGQASASATAQPHIELVLPISVATRSDVSRSLRELNTIDDYFHQAAVRGSKDQQLPAVSSALDSIANENGLNLIHGDDRARIKQFLTRLRANAPAVHMSFPSEASGPFISKLLTWFRSEVHPHTLLRVGLQPELAAGCLVRTTNKVFDFSFRKRFENSKKKLIAAIEATSSSVAEESAIPNVSVEAPAATDSQQLGAAS